MLIEPWGLPGGSWGLPGWPWRSQVALSFVFSRFCGCEAYAKSAKPHLGDLGVLASNPLNIEKTRLRATGHLRNLDKTRLRASEPR